MAKTTTDKVLGVAVAGLLLYEAWTLINKDSSDTESESVWRLAAKRPLVPFMLGVLMGHFFWQTPDTYKQYEDK